MNRTELHCVTTESEFPTVLNPGLLVKKAYAAGMKAVAIADKNTVRAFMDAYHVWRELLYKERGISHYTKLGNQAEGFMKVIYGMEAYLVDDTDIPKDDKNRLKQLEMQSSGHILIYVKNQVGLKDLYKLFSLAHTEYKGLCPLIPKSEIEKRRSNLLIGSCGECGDVNNAIAFGRTDDEIEKIADFYDFFELLPCRNMTFYVDEAFYGEVWDINDLERLGQKVIALGDKLNIPVIASSVVEYFEEDALAAEILACSQGCLREEWQEADHHMMSTEELLGEFTYLGEDKAKEIVITNPDRIADQIDYLCVENRVHPPIQMAEAKEKLETVCMNRAHEIYGPEIPVEVEKRLRRELDGIAKNGFAGIFLINQLLTQHVHEDGVLYGYRGSAGASLVAYLAGITWTNPLPAHYVCPTCHYADFDMTGIEGYHRGDFGADLPDRTCPICGQPLEKEGYDIPEECFLGGHFDKQPDFDYNFPVGYRDGLFDYVKTLPGISAAYRCGSGLYMGEQHSHSLVDNHCAEFDIKVTDEEIENIVRLLELVREGSEYHPGGVILIPEGVDINEYTPIENTKHGESIHYVWYWVDGLYKLDLLTMNQYNLLTYLKDETGTDPMFVPVDDEKVLSLFTSPEALDADVDKLAEIETGMAGTIRYLDYWFCKSAWKLRVHSFADFVRIMGYGHGSRKWDDVTKRRIADENYNKILPANRDDVMLYLIDQGVERNDAFTIMEFVRKGRKLKPEHMDILKKHDVPDWYIEELSKIEYLFPKSHSVIYALTSYIELYYKLYYPEVFYKGWIKCVSENAASLASKGYDGVVDIYRKLKQTTADTEFINQNRLLLGEAAVFVEMYARGYDPEKLLRDI